MSSRLGRYLGFGGSLAIAAASFAAGARQTGQPGPLDWQRLTEDARYAVGCTAWVIGIAALLMGWWLTRGETSLRRVIVTTTLWTAPLLATAPIASRDVYAYANQGALYAAGMNPYKAGPADLPTPWLNQMDDYWFTEPTPYGPLFILLAAVAAVISSGNLTVAVVVLRLLALGGLIACVYLIPKLAKHCGVAPASALWLAAACPLTLIHMAGGAHNEALMMAGVLAACLLALHGPALKGSMWWCAAALAAAVAIKATALVAVPFVILLLTRRRDVRSMIAVAWRPVLAGLGVFAAVTIVSGLGLGWVSAISVSGKSISWLSPPTGIGIASAKVFFQLGVDEPAYAMVPLWRAIGLGLAAVAVFALWWRARGAAPAAVLAATGWAFAAVTLGGPVLLPWYVLAPLLLLACGVSRRATVTGIAVVASVLVLIVFPDGRNIAAEHFVKPGLIIDVFIAAALVFVAWRWFRAGKPAEVEIR